MATAAFTAWALTALGGLVLAITWISRGGLRQDRKLEDASVRGGAQYPHTADRREQHHGLSSTLVFGHGALALVGLAGWGGYVLSGENRAAAAILALLLVPVVALGLTMFSRWQRGDRTGGEVGPEVPEKPADQYLHPAIVYTHGLAALATVVLVVAAAITIA
ncbi:MAG: hypothetical protein M3203_08525 [Actinomycetota bacterium]|nr:hypothetical protein [Actinomycetota bacterium]